jgi:hypothetical protein
LTPLNMCVTGGKVKVAMEMKYDPDRLLFFSDFALCVSGR